MLQTGKIKIRDLKELQAEDIITPKNCTTPLRKRKNPKSLSQSKTQKKVSEQENEKNLISDNFDTKINALTKTTTKKLLKTAIKETPSNQKRIDSYFASCPKTYEIKLPKEEPPTPFAKTKSKTTAKKTNNKTAGKKRNSPRRPKAGRKRLFSESTEPTNESMSDLSTLRGTTKQQNECITIDSDSEDDNDVNAKNTNQTKTNCSLATITTIGDNPAPASTIMNAADNSGSPQQYNQTKTNCSLATITTIADNLAPASTIMNAADNSGSPQQYNSGSSEQYASYTVASSLDFGLRMSQTSRGKSTSTNSTSGAASFSRRKPKPCPPYKIIENTSFAVDAFQFGYIENVTHYFLTHFHADHYIGLTKSFAMPLYMSAITARLLRTFIPVQEQYIHVLELNQTYTVNNIEITALDANHCPGSILIVFKNLATNKCILHTGDFRAWFGMESEPIFWNNHIDTIYLDTTYISDKYAFCTQSESIAKAEQLIEEFQKKHDGKRILYICGSYIVGKEKFWVKLAETFKFKVWAEGNRYKALKAMDEEQFNNFLVEEPEQANMHVIAMGKVSYIELVDYFKSYEEQYDILFAIRPSGWEKDAKPRYSKKINIVGIEYSEHSSYAEMQRFVKFLKPENVISTVPTGKDLMKTAKVPLNWYKYKELKSFSRYQPTIDTFMQKKSTQWTAGSIRPPNCHKGGVECFVSPLKSVANKQKEINNNLQMENAISLLSSKPSELEESCDGGINSIKTDIVDTQNGENTNNFANKTPALSKTTTSKLSHNSSDDFERPDVIIAAKRLPKMEKEQETTKHKSKTTKTPIFQARKLQLTNKELKEKDTNIIEENITIDSPDYFMHRYLKDVMKQELPSTSNNLKKDRKSNNGLKLNQTPGEDHDFQLKQQNSQTSAEKTLQQLEEINITRKRNLRSKTTSSSSDQQNKSETKPPKKKLLKQKSKDNPIIKSTSSIISIDSSNDNEQETLNVRTVIKTETSDIHDSDDIKTTTFGITDESQDGNSDTDYVFRPINKQKPETENAYNINTFTNKETETKAEQQHYSIQQEFKISQNPRSTKKSTSSSKATSTTSSNKVEKEFEKKLQKIAQKQNKISQQKSNKNSTKLLKSHAVNPIYKSNTSIESVITDEELQTIKILTPQKTNDYNSDKSSDDFELVTKTKCLKRPLNGKANSTPFKKANITSSQSTKEILNTILETNEDLEDVDRLNVSQLAGLVVDRLNKHNPDESKDHIPADLLSDADDDWI